MQTTSKNTINLIVVEPEHSSTATDTNNIYVHYRELREQGGDIVWDAKAEKWLVLSYALVKEAARDERLATHSTSIEADGGFFTKLPANVLTSEELEKLQRLYQMLSRQLILVSDKADHARLRGLMSRAFTPRAVETLRTDIEAISESLIDRLLQSSNPDLIRDLAEPLPILVISSILGLPELSATDQANFRHWSKALISLLTIQTDAASKLTSLREIATATTELTDYLKRAITANAINGNGQGGLMATLVEAVQSGLMSQDELIANLLLLIVAGHETTIHLIGNTLYLLLAHPDQLQLVRNQPELVQQAVEEALRFETPLQFAKRIATCDFELGGKLVRRGERVLLMLGAANRDANQFERPDCFDVTRPGAATSQSTWHLAFGHGMHYCLGKFLAVAEAQIAVRILLEKIGDKGLTLAMEPSALQWRNDPAVRGLEHLIISYTDNLFLNNLSK